MTDLVTWLRARLDEDEAAAKAANAVDTESVGEWTVVETSLCIPGGRTAIDVTVESSLDWTLCDGIGSGSLAERRSLAEHIARHDPARVLADVAAKRAIVDEAAAAFAAREERMTGTEIRQNEGERYAFTLTLRHLAYAYHVAGAEGWREEWRP